MIAAVAVALSQVPTKTTQFSPDTLEARIWKTFDKRIDKHPFGSLVKDVTNQTGIEKGLDRIDDLRSKSSTTIESSYWTLRTIRVCGEVYNRTDDTILRETLEYHLLQNLEDFRHVVRDFYTAHPHGILLPDFIIESYKAEMEETRKIFRLESKIGIPCPDEVVMACLGFLLDMHQISWGLGSDERIAFWKRTMSWYNTSATETNAARPHLHTSFGELDMRKTNGPDHVSPTNDSGGTIGGI